MKEHIHCPNSSCASKNTKGRFWIKKGYYKPSHSKYKIPRYKCKVCGANFSSRSVNPLSKSRRPDLDRKIFELFCEGVSQRGIARLTGCNRLTVSSKIKKASSRVPELQERFLKLQKRFTRYIQYDELETYQITKLKPVSVSIAIDPETRILIGLHAAQMPCKGKLQKVSNDIYGKFQDKRTDARVSILYDIAKFAFNGDIHTDGAPALKGIFGGLSNFRHVPHNRLYHKKHKMDDYNPEIKLKQAKKIAEEDKNPLWFVDFICAKLRARCAIFSRRTWTTAKGIEEIQIALNLFLAYHNRLPLFIKNPKDKDFLGPIPPNPNRVRVISKEKAKLLWKMENGYDEEWFEEWE